MTVTVLSLTLTGSDTVTRGDTATYTASITPEGLTLNDTLTFNWTYTTTVRHGRDPVSITESIDATAQTTTWSGAMVSSGTLEVRTTVNGTELVQTMDVTVNNRTWGTDVSITTDTTGLDTEEPRQHSDLGDVEYDIQYTPADDLETAKVSSGPNKGIWYIASLNLIAPLVVKINKHFGMAETVLPACWVAFKKANTRYGEIEGKVKTRLGFDGTTSGTLYGSWVTEIEDNDAEADLEDFMEVPNRLLFDYENQIADRVESLRTSRKAGMATRISGWSPSGITINYDYFVADAGEDQTVDVNTEVIFDGSASCLPAGRTINDTSGYSWNFGSDADPAASIGVSPSCRYSTTGAKTVTLTVTDSEGDTSSDTMIVIVEELSKRHPDIPVGMMGIHDVHLPALDRSFHSIYVGDSSFSNPACNYLHSYGHNFDVNNRWGLTSDYFRIEDDDGNPEIRAKRPMRNAKAWANFVKKVSDVNRRLGGAKLKCLISNRLMHLYRSQDPNYLDWDVDELQTFVRQTIHMIDDILPTRTNPNPKDIVAGWYLEDDGLKNDVHNAERLSEVVEAVHCAQKACGVNWPFYFADNVDDDIFWNQSQTDVVIPNKLKDWVKKFPDDATPVFMPYYYPWIANNWNYTEHPPWKKWKLYIDKLHEEFFGTEATTTHPNLKFHPILDASEKMAYRPSPTPQDPDRKIRDTANLPLPGHADMHKQFRVVWNLLHEYDSVTGMWLLGWNIDDGEALQRATAHNNWTVNPGETEADSGVAKSRRWAEAIQNEPHATEGILEAVPDISKVYPAFTVRNIPGKRIPYSLSERKRFEIRIYDGNIDENPNAKLVRTLDEGYDGVSPQGEFRNSNHVPYRYEELRGTSAYWDGSKDIETEASVFFAYLYLDGEKVHGPERITI